MSLSQGGECLSCQLAVDLEVLLPHLAGVAVDRATGCRAGLPVVGRVRAEGDCPPCGAARARVHSRYERRLADAAVGGRRVVIRLQVRRLFCDVPDCPERTFAEQVPGLTARVCAADAAAGRDAGGDRRRAGRAGGGAAGRRVRVTGRPVTLLRLVMALPDPAAGGPAGARGR